ncbi:hypothetical protein SAICODRAFT_25356 [Saitoella complicata NRRL Y-17804]|uniref:Uncharacterized protein n=1 Tax=Saitoella complicata (strain BCRC 22490 / CBS 7301 / JCM 7358 / NBRC 10748 / NRRL Y-17804) TaxID=698492 RepID=A0A0E9N9N1_SAICN|nr:uncharacterized protein SAICODRAFT_25356 [Saitoella complicata NRRL Y-17804]ODQ53280.1 hypothetical protein SAICODRAFT_25356 [Saitoella complicata NRRL Y-17804]GAO46406.1 hypothetical protein G7K_0637-t1 [Saitoella complicata NRRL Y-17804]
MDDYDREPSIALVDHSVLTRSASRITPPSRQGQQHTPPVSSRPRRQPTYVASPAIQAAHAYPLDARLSDYMRQVQGLNAGASHQPRGERTALWPGQHVLGQTILPITERPAETVDSLVLHAQRMQAWVFDQSRPQPATSGQPAPANYNYTPEEVHTASAESPPGTYVAEGGATQQHVPRSEAAPVSPQAAPELPTEAPTSHITQQPPLERTKRTKPQQFVRENRPEAPVKPVAPSRNSTLPQIQDSVATLPQILGHSLTQHRASQRRGLVKPCLRSPPPHSPLPDQKANQELEALFEQFRESDIECDSEPAPHEYRLELHVNKPGSGRNLHINPIGWRRLCPLSIDAGMSYKEKCIAQFRLSDPFPEEREEVLWERYWKERRALEERQNPRLYDRALCGDRYLPANYTPPKHGYIDAMRYKVHCTPFEVLIKAGVDRNWAKTFCDGVMLAYRQGDLKPKGALVTRIYLPYSLHRIEVGVVTRAGPDRTDNVFALGYRLLKCDRPVPSDSAYDVMFNRDIGQVFSYDRWRSLVWTWWEQREDGPERWFRDPMEAADIDAFVKNLQLYKYIQDPVIMRQVCLKFLLACLASDLHIPATERAEPHNYGTYTMEFATSMMCKEDLEE